MAVAEALCAERGQRLTPIRRKVLAALLGSHKPLGAYEIIDRIAPKGRAPGTHHRLSRARVSARERPRAPHREPQRLHRLRAQSRRGDLVVFLICERCGAVGEASSAEVTSTLTSAARAAGFTPKSPVIEISGVCTHCREAEEDDADDALSPNLHEAGCPPARPAARCCRGYARGRALPELGFQSGRGEARAARDSAAHPGRLSLDFRRSHRRRLGAPARRETDGAGRHARSRHHRRLAVRAGIPADLSRPGVDQREPRLALHLHRAVLRRHRRALASARRPLRPLAVARSAALLRRDRGGLRRAHAGRRSTRA